MRTNINPKCYEMELKDFISSLEVLYEVEGVPLTQFRKMLTVDWKGNQTGKTKSKRG